MLTSLQITILTLIFLQETVCKKPVLKTQEKVNEDYPVLAVKNLRKKI